jgi:molecular chaperone GrpE
MLDDVDPGIATADHGQRTKDESAMTRIPIEDDNDAQAAQTPETPADEEMQSTADAPASPGAGPDVQRLQAERDDFYQRLVRATADFKNTQKRIQGEADQRVQYANQSLIKSLLPVIDNFERALAQDAGKVDAAAILRGMQIVHDQWLNVLKQQQVDEIAPKPGDPFDPSRHEALMQQDAPQYAGKGQAVVQLLQKGYSLGERVLRPAQVAVSRSS